MSVTYPLGFRAAGTAAGMKPSGRPDLGLLAADAGATATGLFTTNAFPAAPVTLSRSRLAGGSARAVLVNSGQANAATGERGERDARESTRRAAELLGVESGEVLSCSTGVIGRPVEMEALTRWLPVLAGRLSREGGPQFAEAIMTTDTVRKEARSTSGPYRVGGCAKGVGMIAPDLATMLAFLTTDAPLETSGLRALASGVLAPAFESLTVDACCSTNDTVLLFASGAAGGHGIAPGSPEWEGLAEAVSEVAESLVHQLAADAEGGSHVLVVEVAGAASDADALRVAKAVAESPLVKAAAFGGDPNPGRLLQSVGSSGADFRPKDVAIRIGSVEAVTGGEIPSEYTDAGDAAARIEMKQAEIHYSIVLGNGPGRARVLGSDLSYDYVRINAEYTT